MHIKSRLIFMMFGLLLMGSKVGVAMLDKSRDEKPVALMNGVAHLGNGETIENAVITFAKGKITLVADARLVRLDLSGYKVIDIFSKHLYLIKECSSNENQKCFDIITDTSSRQLTEDEPANLMVTANEVDCSDNSVVHVFIGGQAQFSDHFMVETKQLKIK